MTLHDSILDSTAQSTGGSPRAADDAVACTHCGLPVPAGLVRTAEDSGGAAARQFCCHGCETAYSVIHGCGLDAYYRLAREFGGNQRVKGDARSFREFDDGVFHQLYVRPAAGVPGALSVDLFLQNVHCTACVWLVEKLPRLAPGVIESRLDLRRGAVRVTWDPSRVELSRIARALASIGYAPHPARDARSRATRAREDREHLVRIGVAGGCAGNIMIYAVAQYAGMFEGMEPAHHALMSWMSLGATLVCLLWPGRLFLRGAWAALRTRTPHLDVPIALAVVTGAVWSVISTVRASGEVYFDAVSALIFLLLVGRFIQHRQQRWAADALELLFCVTPASARRVEDDGEARETPTEALRPGDVVEVRAGESIPADAVVILGRSAIDQAVLTGESRPVEIGPADSVSAGAVNLGATIRARVTATGEQTRVGRLMRMVEDATRRRAPIVRFTDRVGAWFLFGMVGAAALTFFLWLPMGVGRAIECATALLVVTCPCALGLATPLSLTVALGRAARSGMLIKGADAIQRLAARGRTARTIFLDKTGTITEGGLALVAWTGDNDARPLAAALERQSTHPVAAALARDLALPAALAAAPGVASTDESSAASFVVDGVRQTPGLGIQGVVNGVRVAVGSPAFVRALGATGSPALDAAIDSALRHALTPVCVALDGELVGVAALGDRVRADAPASVARLRHMGWRIGILSGDHPEVVRAMGERLGLDPALVRGGLSPEAKVRAVTDAARAGEVVMVGDGINDAAALAAAGVGVAVHGGAEASMAAADVYLSRPGLSGVADLVEGSRRVMGVVRRGLWISAAYNIGAGALAMAGIISPIIAALIMPVSSLTTMTLSFRSRTYDARREGVQP